jgi:Tol biopolymer transport system component
MFIGVPIPIRPADVSLVMRQFVFRLAVLAFCTRALPSAAQPLSPHDIVSIRLAKDARLSPDARRVAFVISEPAGSEQAARRSGIWTVATDGSDPPRLQISGGDDSFPRWSPDGKSLAFLSVRGEALPAARPARQIYRIRMDPDRAGGPEALTSVEGGVDEFAWSPDGRFIAFTSPEGAVEEDPVVVGRNLQYTRFGVLDVSARTVSLMTGRDFDVQELAWSPKGDEIALVVAPSPRPEDQLRLALVVVNTRTGKIGRRLSENVALPGVLRWSPEGRFITFLECPPSREFAFWLAMVPAAGGQSQPLLKDRPLSVLRAEWTPDSRSLVLLTIEGTRQALSKLDLQSDRMEPIADVLASQAEFGFTTDGSTIAYLGQTARSPTDV